MRMGFPLGVGGGYRQGVVSFQHQSPRLGVAELDIGPGPFRQETFPNSIDQTEWSIPFLGGVPAEWTQTQTISFSVRHDHKLIQSSLKLFKRVNC